MNDKGNIMDILTDINLNLIDKNNGSEYYTSFLDENGNRLIDDPKAINPKILADYMVEKELIQTNGEMCHMKKTGYDAINKGGWIEYNNHLSILSKRPLTNKQTANNHRQSNKNLAIKFWKLISENPLVSGLILAAILYAIKIIFNIEL